MTVSLFFFPSSPLRVWQHTAAVTVSAAVTAPLNHAKLEARLVSEGFKPL